MEYPTGTKFNDWIIVLENQKGVIVPTIRRWVILPDGNRKYERLPAKKYQHVRNNKPELDDFLIRLNNRVPKEVRTKQAVEFKHAFISPKLLDQYEGFLKLQVSKNKAKAEYSFMKNYFLNFFINKMNLADPIQWHRIHKSQWAEYLLSDEAPASIDAKKMIIRSANRFMSWLHDQRPDEVSPLVFKPLTRSKLKEVEAKRKSDGDYTQAKFIPDKDWKIIEKNLTSELKPFALLAYKFGLRRAETLGLKLSDVRKGFLSVERQLLSLGNNSPEYGPLKGREKRRVPYWFSNPSDAYNLIQEATIHIIHPSGLSEMWSEFMDSLGFDYRFHDLRHTWTTKAIRNQEIRDVQLAAGHKDIRTTMKYSHDDRETEEQIFKPGA